MNGDRVSLRVLVTPSTLCEIDRRASEHGAARDVVGGVLLDLALFHDTVRSTAPATKGAAFMLECTREAAQDVYIRDALLGLAYQPPTKLDKP
jgi:hypothetical protein